MGKYNTSRNGAAQVLAAIDPDLVRAFNETLSEQWKVYSHAVGLYQLRWVVSSTWQRGVL